MKLTWAFAGFRHGHIHGLYQRVAADSGNHQILAACEEDAATRTQLAGRVAITHDSVDKMLAETNCDILAIGDYYARRGKLAIQGLKAGCHIMSDKPLCTSLDELEQISDLAAEKKRCIGCMLDLRDAPPFTTLKTVIDQGRIGTIQAIQIGGQHPLNRGVRPEWYFEPGKHGGTINDIAIHAFDLIPWLTGSAFNRVIAARCWNAMVSDAPHFRDAAQMMLALDNGCGVLGDVSYFSPSGAGYSLPAYWRITLWGEKGVLETSLTAENISLGAVQSDKLEYLSFNDGNPGGYLKAFLAEIAHAPIPGGVTTESVLTASRVALLTQQAGDQGLTNLFLN